MSTATRDLPFEDPPAAVVPPIGSAADAAWAACAWCLLTLIELAMRLAGFERFYGLVRRWPTIGAAPADRSRELATEASAAINRARTFYLKRAWCLQRAAATVCLLRLRGVRAELVIGVRKFPFYAHAWAEVDGTVINDRPSLRTRYSVIARC